MDDNLWDDNLSVNNEPWQTDFENTSDPFELFDDDISETPEVDLSSPFPSFTTPILARELANMAADWVDNDLIENTPTDSAPMTDIPDEDIPDEDISDEDISDEDIPFPSSDDEAEIEDMLPPFSSQENIVASERSTLGGLLEDIFNFFWGPSVPNDAFVPQSSFSNGGMFDEVNNLTVIGNVKDDINYIDEQTGGTCSLMAQEQFVHRYMDKGIPEHILEAIGECEEVYDPEQGTCYEGQARILDIFNVPYERTDYASVSMLEYELEHNHDCLVGVDAREFYNDPTIPPNSGHAVAVVGKGVDPATGNTEGFYVTDSNYPDGAHFVTVDDFERCWYNDMISVPNIQEA